MRIFLRQPVAHGANVTGNALSNVCFVFAFFVEDADGDALLFAQMNVRVWVVVEERGRRRGSWRRSGCCRYVCGVSVLLIVAVAALAAMFVLCWLPSLADRTTELPTGSMNRCEQAQPHMSTATCERASMCDASALVGASGTKPLTLSAR